MSACLSNTVGELPPEIALLVAGAAATGTVEGPAGGKRYDLIDCCFHDNPAAAVLSGSDNKIGDGVGPKPLSESFGVKQKIVPLFDRQKRSGRAVRRDNLRGRARPSGVGAVGR